MNSVVIQDATQGQWLHFCNPKQAISAYRVEEVMAALEAIEEQVRQHGLYAAGFIAYEAAPAFDSALAVKEDGAFPLLWFGLYEKAEQLHLPTAPETQSASLLWQPSLTSDAYQDALGKIKDYIEAGDTYQVNFTVRLRSPFSGDPWPYFIELARAQDALYSAFVNTKDWIICSASPELFVQVEGDELISRPMKGTAPRGLMLPEDREQADWLHHSEKNRAENVMIVDMVRNDMGRIANTGSVHVSRLYEVEKYPTVWQMTSTVKATTEAGLCAIMQALFPPASITGAPKRRTMQIIAELEHAPRRIYTGTVGFWMPDHRAQFNVAIRTVLIDKATGEAEYGVGGGIVWDSIDTMEFEECQIKARILTQQVPDFSLLESILWTPEEGYFLLQYHLARLTDSAAYFSYAADMDAIRNKLDSLARTLPKSAHKVRLLVAKDGAITLQSEALGNAPATDPLHVCLAPAPIDPSNPFLYHKTTNRGVYEQALTASSGYTDCILWNEKGEVTESSIANCVVELEGKLCTPPIQCGLLPGTYRAYLLEQGKIKERVIRIEDLATSPHIYLVNSVRREREVMVDMEGIKKRGLLQL
ncbi:MAG: aminodeoxychorismate synthase component I [Deltaproteobacteria bacterium]|nr:aminodeoxychorismate synthase component I [Deltaproteobacteria bacterium]